MEQDNRNGNIFLIGLMGAGKTTVGKALAKRLHRPFFDSDHEVESRTGVRIPVIFEHEGEEGFRQRETEALVELTQRTGVVLATGGGAVLREENRRMLQSRGRVIYLCASPHDLWLRTRRDKNRPLLQIEDPRARLETLFAARDPIYRACADFIVETGRPSIASLANIIMMQLDLTGDHPLLADASAGEDAESASPTSFQEDHRPEYPPSSAPPESSSAAESPASPEAPNNRPTSAE